MRSASLDRRVRKEARALVREARGALNVKKGLRGKAGDLETATAEIEQGLANKDLQRVRMTLPVLDSLVDELIKRPSKSTTRDYVESIGAAILIALALRAFVIEAFKIPSSSMYPTLEIGDHIFVNKFIYGLGIPWTNIKLFQLREPHRGEVIVFKYPCDPERDYIKRVVALGGDTVEVRCNIVYVNGVGVASELVNPLEKYEDKPEESDKWEWRDVSRYRETVAGFTYETFHSEERPIQEAKRATEPHRGDRDFPDEVVAICPAGKAASQVPGKIVETRPSADPCALQRHYVVPEGHVFVMGDNRSNSNDGRAWGSVPVESIKGKALFIWLSYRTWDPVDGIRWSRIGNFVH